MAPLTLRCTSGVTSSTGAISANKSTGTSEKRQVTPTPNSSLAYALGITEKSNRETTVTILLTLTTFFLLFNDSTFFVID